MKNLKRTQVTIDSENSKLNRRQFLIRSSKAGISVAAACAIGYGYYDSKGPDPSASPKKTVQLPDYSVAGVGKKMVVVRNTDRIAAVRTAFETMGGIGTFIEKGDRVLLKVNAAFASPPMLSATTHPQLVSELSRLCFKAGAKQVIVTDNPINDPVSCFSLTGISEAARTAGAQVFMPKDHFFQTMTISGTRLIQNWPILYEPLKGVNKVIGMAPLKDHHRSGASMTMKNWYGLLGGRRNIFHQDIHTIIADLAKMMTPTLVILDAINSMVSNGPTGGSLSDLKATNTLIVSTDQVAADAYGAQLLGKSADDLAYISKAESLGVGTADFRTLNPDIL